MSENMFQYTLKDILEDPMQSPVIKDIFWEVFGREYSNREIAGVLADAPDQLLAQLADTGVRTIASITGLGEYLERVKTSQQPHS